MKHKYYLGIAEMDQQHERIIHLAHRAKADDMNEAEMQLIIVELLDYAKTHLEEEEAYLKEQGLIDFLNVHIKHHIKFREHAMDLYHQFRDLEAEAEKRKLLHRVAEFCESWLLHHINVEDREYAELIKDRKP